MIITGLKPVESNYRRINNPCIARRNRNSLYQPGVSTIPVSSGANQHGMRLTRRPLLYAGGVGQFSNTSNDQKHAQECLNAHRRIAQSMATILASSSYRIQAEDKKKTRTIDFRKCVVSRYIPLWGCDGNRNVLFMAP